MTQPIKYSGLYRLYFMIPAALILLHSLALFSTAHAQDPDYTNFNILDLVSNNSRTFCPKYFVWANQSFVTEPYDIEIEFRDDFHITMTVTMFDLNPTLNLWGFQCRNFTVPLAKINSYFQRYQLLQPSVPIDLPQNVDCRGHFLLSKLELALDVDDETAYFYYHNKVQGNYVTIEYKDRTSASYNNQLLSCIYHNQKTPQVTPTLTPVPPTPTSVPGPSEFKIKEYAVDSYLLINESTLHAQSLYSNDHINVPVGQYQSLFKLHLGYHDAFTVHTKAEMSFIPLLFFEDPLANISAVPEYVGTLFTENVYFIETTLPVAQLQHDDLNLGLVWLLVTSPTPTSRSNFIVRVVSFNATVSHNPGNNNVTIDAEILIPGNNNNNATITDIQQGGCFPANTIIHVQLPLKSHTPDQQQEYVVVQKQMQDLRIGDRVQIAKNLFSPVYFFSDKKTHGNFTFVQLHTAHQSITLTPSHYIFVRNSQGQTKLTVAGAVKVGDRLIALRNKNEIQHDNQHDSENEDESTASVTVLSIQRNVQQRGLVAPYTKEGVLVVGGVKVSCHTQTMAPGITRTLLSPLYFVYSLLCTGNQVLCPFRLLEQDYLLVDYVSHVRLPFLKGKLSY